MRPLHLGAQGGIRGGESSSGIAIDDGREMLMKKYGAEFIGTFWLVLGGCGSAVLAAAFPNVGIGLLGVALAFGLTRA